MSPSDEIGAAHAAPADAAPVITEKTKVLVGSLVLYLLALPIIGILGIYGSLLDWPADRVTDGLFSVSGWNYHNLVSGDGKIAIVLVIVILLLLSLAIVTQKKGFFGAMFPVSLLYFGFIVYEMIFISTRKGLIGNGLGIEMTLISALAAVLCSLTGYFMLRSLDAVET